MLATEGVRSLGVSLVAVLLATSALAQSAPGEAAGAPAQVEYEPVGLPDYVTVGVGFGLSVVANLFNPRAEVPAQLNGFDEAARDVVRLKDPTARFSIRDASDLTISLLMMGPILGDAFLNVGWYRKDLVSAWRMGIVNLEAFAVTGALQAVTNVLVSRERPFGRTCGGETPADTHDCEWDTRYRSFYSGHSSFSFTGAALLCRQHVKYKLFGGGAAEVATCGAGFALAAATALFRMMGDMHYASDVLVGAAMGTAVGFLVPEVHERVWGTPTSAPGLRVTIVPSGAGVSVMGVW